MKRSAPPLIPESEMREQAACVAEIAALENRPRRYHIITYGCQMNAHDSETIAGMLMQMGMEKAPSREEADLILFNTCCIRDNAERRALGNMAWLKQHKREHPDLVLCVCGCMIQQPQMAQTILKRYPFFDVAFGTHNLHRFPSLLLRALETRRQIIEVREEEGRIAEGMPVRRESPHRAYLTIMYGCDNFCSYCIVPYVRGRERSRDVTAILREAESLLEDGVQEIMLLGQNVNSYGNDLPEGVTFSSLLRELNALGVPRIRFMTSHPKDLSDDLIRAMADSRHVAKHLHLPVQSGSDAILAAMRRVYTREGYLERVRRLREAMPDLALTTDLIVGFPNESDADFENTLSLVESVRYDSTYTFIFSPREGTRAAGMPGMVALDIASARIARLIDAQERITAEIYQGLVGSTQCVLVDEVSKRDAAQVSGKCERGITCSFAGNQAQIGSFAHVVVTAAGHNTLKAALKEAQA